VNVSAPKFMIEGTWRGRLFGAEWRNAAGTLFSINPIVGMIFSVPVAFGANWLI
jgi:hypothetical protein